MEEKVIKSLGQPKNVIFLGLSEGTVAEHFERHVKTGPDKLIGGLKWFLMTMYTS